MFRGRATGEPAYRQQKFGLSKPGCSSLQTKMHGVVIDAVSVEAVGILMGP